MKKNLLLLVSCVLIGALNAVERAELKLPDENKKYGKEELATMKAQADDNLTKAQEAERKAASLEDQRDAQQKQLRAKYIKTFAERAELELDPHYGDPERPDLVDKYNKLGKDLEFAEGELRNVISAGLKELASSVQTIQKPEDIAQKLEKLPMQLQDFFAVRDKNITKEVERSVLTQLDEVQKAVDKATNELMNQALKEPKFAQKSDMLYSALKNAKNMNDIVKKELYDVAKGEIIGRSFYREKLQGFSDALDKKIEKIYSADLRSLAQEEKKKPFLRSAMESFKKWWDRLFMGKNIIEINESVNKQLNQARVHIEPIAQLADNVKEVSDEANILRQELSRGGNNDRIQRAQELITTLNNIEEQVRPLDQALIEESFDRLKKLRGQMESYAERVRKYDTLFDTLQDHYNNLLKKTGYGAEDLYKVLGLERNASKDQIEAMVKDYEQLSQAQTEEPLNKAKRQATFILRDPISKETYDAFLHDYDAFVTKFGEDALGGPRSSEQKQFLNDKRQGKLPKLEISSKSYDNLRESFGERNMNLTAATTPGRIESPKEQKKIPLLENLEQTRNALENAVKQAQEKQKQIEIPQ